MPKLIYFAIASVDGYVEDERGKFDWAAPDEEVHAFINDVIRPVSMFFYGRRMYETMQAWDHIEGGVPVHLDFAGIWKAATKVVFSRTLDRVVGDRTRLEREFRPELVRRMMAETGGHAAIGGAELASLGFSARLIDEVHLLLAPYTAGGGKRALPDGVALRLEFGTERGFTGGMVYLKYQVHY